MCSLQLTVAAGRRWPGYLREERKRQGGSVFHIDWGKEDEKRSSQNNVIIEVQNLVA